MANRNLLIDIGENVRWESAFLPSGVFITNAGKILTRGSGAAVQSACRAGAPRKRGRLWAAAKVTGATCAFGLGTTFATNAVNLGGDAAGETWGVWFGSSGVNQWNTWHAGVGSASLGSCFSGDYLWVVVDIQDGNVWLGYAPAASPSTVTWAGGGDPSAGSTPTYSGMNASGTIKANVARAYYLMGSTYTAPDAVQLITEHDNPAASNFYLSGMTPWGEWGYYAANAIATSPTDTQWVRYYDGRLAPDGDPEYTRSVSVWTFGSGESSTLPISNIDLLNNDGALDWMERTDAKDVRITGWLYNLAANASSQLVPDSSTWTKAFSLIADHVEPVDEDTMRFTISDSLARLSLPIQNNFYPATVPNAALIGQAMPFMLGFNRFVPFVAYDIANLEFDFCDSPQGPVNAVYDQGVVIAQGTGWQFSRSAGAHGLTRVTNPAGKQSADINGQMTLAFQAGGPAEPFGAWASGAPANMIVTIGASCTLTNPSGTIAQFNCSANQANHTSTLQSAYIPPGVPVWIELICNAFTSGYIEVVALPVTNTVNTAAGAVLCKIDRPGTYRIAFTSDNVHRAIGIQWGKVICNVQLSGGQIYTAGTTDSLASWVNEICINRVGMTASEVDTAGTIATLSAVGYTLATYQQAQQVTALDLLQLACDSHTGGMWQDRLGVLKMGRLVEPSTLSPAMTFDDSNVDGQIVISDDYATGLSARLYGVKNNNVHGDSDLAGSVINTTTATTLKAPWGTIATGVGNLDSFYDDANKRDPRPTCISTAGFVQTEATRVVGSLYNTRRHFYAFDAFCTDVASYTIEPFTCIQLIIGNGNNITVAGVGRQRYFLGGGGILLLVISAKSRFLSDRVSFFCWG